MGDTSETNTKVLSRELLLGVVALKRLYRKSLFARQGPFSQVRSHMMAKTLSPKEHFFSFKIVQGTGKGLQMMTYHEGSSCSYKVYVTP